jgi:hypothetical protein
VSAGVGNNILVDVFTHPMIPLREIITPPRRGFNLISFSSGDKKRPLFAQRSFLFKD